jgi:DNA polymerase-3 subunit alpha
LYFLLITNIPNFCFEAEYSHTYHAIATISLDQQKMPSNLENLKELVFEGAREKIPLITDPFLDGINYELSEIERQGFVDYFILFSRIIEVCNELNLLRSPGRGSAPHSVVNFCLDITKINPIGENFIFERFLNPHQKRLPDIDIDISKGHQKQLLDRLKEKYPEYSIHFIAHSSPTGSDYKTVVHKGDEYKQHSSGIIITTENLSTSTFIHEAQEFYLVSDPATDPIYDTKVDLVELEYLNRLQLIVDEIGEEYHPYRIPLTDQKVFDFFTSDNLEYIFQFNTPAHSAIFADFKPVDIYDLSLINATFRRGLKDYIPTLTANKNNGDNFPFDHPLVNEILSDSYGILVYQETFLHLANKLAGMNFAEAESWRRKIMVDKTNVALTEFISKFIVDCRNHSTLTQNDIEMLISMISNMIRLTFSKSHSLSYSIIGYWGAFYKTYFRVQFEKAFERGAKFQPFELF